MEIFKKNKAVIKFLGIFFGTYIVFTLGYQFYLDNADSEVYFPEPITHIVALQTESLVNFFGYETKMIPSHFDPSMRLGIDGKYLVRVVEGCNAVSVIILFLSFILAFKKDWKTTLLFIFAGSVLIYVFNVLRIALLTIGIYEIPKYQELMHGTLFPIFIYGFVFLLWIFWIRNYKTNLNTVDE
ncbi:exosortase family protein XrtF [Psychroflexus montanilacus]|uniref:exosortase family protein XrtF n=1 Tax=Psychroflexus montanilacus TaxID=2873598 RepID=UPI001CCFAE48|nr:exosortase family protein XrtF [Psychroflexus montanilacus]MBZ9652180.1 exosortase family protein XrtF [Psychroflexus montanilacus]